MKTFTNILWAVAFGLVVISALVWAFMYGSAMKDLNEILTGEKGPSPEERRVIEAVKAIAESAGISIAELNELNRCLRSCREGDGNCTLRCSANQRRRPGIPSDYIIIPWTSAQPSFDKNAE